MQSYPREIDAATQAAIEHARRNEGATVRDLYQRFQIHHPTLATLIRRIDQEQSMAQLRTIRLRWILGDSCRVIGQALHCDKRRVALIVADLVERQIARRTTEAYRLRRLHWSIARIGRRVRWDNATVRRAVTKLDQAHSQQVRSRAQAAFQSGHNLHTIGQKIGIAANKVDQVLNGLHRKELGRLRQFLLLHPTATTRKLQSQFPRWSRSMLAKLLRKLLPHIQTDYYDHPDGERYYSPEKIGQLFGSKSRRVMQKKLRAAQVRRAAVYHPHHRRPIDYYSYTDAIDKLASLLETVLD